jgi:hypothetical protein
MAASFFVPTFTAWKTEQIPKKDGLISLANFVPIELA